jgi:hypothetical protein
MMHMYSVYDFISLYICPVCILLSMFQCPVFDQTNNVQFSGGHQTMTKQAAVVVRVSTQGTVVVVVRVSTQGTVMVVVRVSTQGTVMVVVRVRTQGTVVVVVRVSTQGTVVVVGRVPRVQSAVVVRVSRVKRLVASIEMYMLGVEAFSTWVL